MLNTSFIAMNRIVEDHAATDEKYRAQLERNGKAVLSSGRRLSDEQLLAKLRDLGIDLDRDKLDDLSQRYFSAEELSRTVAAERRSPIRAADEDWVWIVLVCLWERWFPDRASMEMLDDRMQEGYSAREQGNPAAACRLWLDTWRAILASKHWRSSTIVSAARNAYSTGSRIPKGSWGTPAWTIRNSFRRGFIFVSRSWSAPPVGPF
jgi:hypothetical protein